MVITPFDKKYEEIHRQLKENSALVKKAFALAQEKGLFEKGTGKQTYFPLGEFNGIYLGLDLLEWHTKKFQNLLAKMRLIYEATQGKVDLPQVYCQLRNGPSFGEEVGILSEDFSGNGQYEVEESYDGDIFSYPHIEEIIQVMPMQFSFLNMIFTIKTKENPQRVVRTPIIDLDHMFPETKQAKEKVNQYKQQYCSDPRFIIEKSEIT